MWSMQICISNSNSWKGIKFVVCLYNSKFYKNTQELHGVKVKVVTVILTETSNVANVQRDGRPVEHRWRPLFNAVKFG